MKEGIPGPIPFMNQMAGIICINVQGALITQFYFAVWVYFCCCCCYLKVLFLLSHPTLLKALRWGWSQTLLMSLYHLRITQIRFIASIF